MKIVITGATGYIGSHLAHAIGQEHEVFAVVRRNSDTTELGDCVKDCIVFEKDRIYCLLEELGPDACVHLAGVFYGEHSSDTIGDLLESNLIFSAVMFDAAVSAGCRRIINTGTYWQHFSGEEYNPVNLYAATKQAAEDILLYYVKAKGCSAITLQIFDSYGPDDHRRKILNMIRDLDDGARIDMTGGEQKMYYCHIEDLVSGYMQALKLVAAMEAGSYARYALRDENPVSLRKLVEEFLRIQGKHLDINWGGRTYRDREIMDPSGIGTVLPGWKPKYDWEQGVKNL